MRSAARRSCRCENATLPTLQPGKGACCLLTVPFTQIQNGERTQALMAQEVERLGLALKAPRLSYDQKTALEEQLRCVWDGTEHSSGSL